MINEISANPLHPSDFLPEWQQNIEVEPEQKDSLDNLIKSAQSTPSGKRKHRDIAQKHQAHKLTKSEKQKMVGHKMRFLVGENGKINATITTSKEEIDYQFQYPGKNKVIKEYKNIKDFYSWLDEEDSEKVDAEPTKSHIPPKVYDLRTPVKKSDSSPDLSKETEGKTKMDKPMATSSSHATSLVEVILDEEKTRAKCSISGELHCYKNDSIILNISDSHLAQR